MMQCKVHVSKVTFLILAQVKHQYENRVYSHIAISVHFLSE